MSLPESFFRGGKNKEENKKERWERIKSERKDIHSILSETYPELHTDEMVSALHPIYRTLIKKIKTEEENIDGNKVRWRAREALKENYVNELNKFDIDIQFLKNKSKEETKNFVKNNLFEEEKQEMYEKAFDYVENEYDYLER